MDPVATLFLQMSKSLPLDFTFGPMGTVTFDIWAELPKDHSTRYNVSVYQVPVTVVLLLVVKKGLPLEFTFGPMTFDIGG